MPGLLFIQKFFLHKYMLYCLFTGASLFLFPGLSLAERGVVINEFMASNGSVIADEDGDYEDWIELFNKTDDPVNLGGFFLSDDYSDPYKWVFPDHTVIQPGSFLIVWASGKDRSSPHQPLHTNFSIARTGEELILTAPDSVRLDEVFPVVLARDMSLARYPDGTGSWMYSLNPTPGVENMSHQHADFLIHYWIFDTSIPNNQPLETLAPQYSLSEDAEIAFTSCLEGYPFHEDHPLWRKGSLERRNNPTALNYIPYANDHIPYSDANIRGIQVKQPFATEMLENTLFLKTPTTGFRNITITFAAVDEGTGNDLVVDYAVDEEHQTWYELPDDEGILVTGSQYQIYQLDFSHDQRASHNPFFAVRIRFQGDAMHADEGNRVTFNNISVSGEAKKMHYIHATTGPKGLISPMGFNRVFDGESREYRIFPSVNYAIDKVFLNQSEETEMLEIQPNGTGILLLENITRNIDLHATFALDPDYVDRVGGLLVFPNPSDGLLNIMSVFEINRITIFDLHGRIVWNKYVEGGITHTIIPSGLNGLYLIRVNTSQGLITRKVQIFN